MSWPVDCTGAAAPMMPSVGVVTNQISSQTAEMNAPADIASLSTKAIVLPGNFFMSSIISIVTSMAPPGVLMSRTTASACSATASFRPRLRR